MDKQIISIPISTNNDNSSININKISKPLFDVLVGCMDFKLFFKFGSSVCKLFRSFFFLSNRWRSVDLSFMGEFSTDKTIYRLCSILNQYYNKNYFNYIDRIKETDDVNNNNHGQQNEIDDDDDDDDNNNGGQKKRESPLFHSFYIETLIMDKLFQITSNVFKYINNCIPMSNIVKLSIINCTNIKFLNGFFEIPRPNLNSLSLPSLSSNEPSSYYKSLSSLTSLSLPSVEPIQLYRYLESCPLLLKLELNRSKDSLFNPSLLERLYKCVQITHLSLNTMSIRNDIFINMFMSLTNLEVIRINNNFQIYGSAINTALESIPNLRELSIPYCRNVGEIKVHSTKLQIFDSSYTLTNDEISFPNVYDLSVVGWDVTSGNCFSIFSKFNCLKYLDLSKTKINDQILDVILSLIGNSVETLNLEFNNKITNESIDSIKKHCKKIRTVNLGNTSITNYDELNNIRTVQTLRTTI